MKSLAAPRLCILWSCVFLVFIFSSQVTCEERRRISSTIGEVAGIHYTQVLYENACDIPYYPARSENPPLSFSQALKNARRSLVDLVGSETAEHYYAERIILERQQINTDCWFYTIMLSEKTYFENGRVSGEDRFLTLVPMSDIPPEILTQDLVDKKILTTSDSNNHESKLYFDSPRARFIISFKADTVEYGALMECHRVCDIADRYSTLESDLLSIDKVIEIARKFLEDMMKEQESELIIKEIWLETCNRCFFFYQVVFWDTNKEIDQTVFVMLDGSIPQFYEYEEAQRIFQKRYHR